MENRVEFPEASDRWLNDAIEKYVRDRSIIWLAIDSFPSVPNPDWNAGVYALTYHEPSFIPEALRKRGIADDEVSVGGVYHGPGTSDDLLTLAYLDAIEYISHTLEMIARLNPDGKVPFRTIKCSSRSKRWLSQFSSVGTVTDTESMSDRSVLPMILATRIMDGLASQYGLNFNFEFDSNDDGCGLIGMCEDILKADKEDHHGKNK